MTNDNPYSPENPEGNPWTLVSKREIVDNKFVNHTQHEVLNVVGNPVSYTVVSFKNLAVGVIPYEDGYIHLVGQYRYPLKSYSWELPEGGCPKDKKTLDAAKWELEEETGLRAESFEPFLEMHTSNSVTDEWAIVYLATGLTQGVAAPEENEVLQTRKVTLDEFIALVEAGDITDSMTVASAYKLAWLQSRGLLPDSESPKPNGL